MAASDPYFFRFEAHYGEGDANLPTEILKGVTSQHFQYLCLLSRNFSPLGLTQDIERAAMLQVLGQQLSSQ